MATKILIVQLTTERKLDLASELVAALGDGMQIDLLRGADRQKLDMALSKNQYAGVHIAGDGASSLLNCTDGLMPEAEFITMIEAQKTLRFVLLSACDSYEMAAGVHNALHVPVISYAQPIDDRAAVEFARAFYRNWKRDGRVEAAVARGRDALTVLYPDEARKVKLIDGDMSSFSGLAVLRAEIIDAFGRFDERMDTMETKMNSFNDSRHWRLQLAIVVLLAALLVAQVLTPVLNGMLVH